MNPSLEWLAVMAIALVCMLPLLRRIAPAVVWQAQARLSFLLEAQSNHRWIRRFGRAVRPTLVATAGACGSGNGCPRCRACGPGQAN